MTPDLNLTAGEIVWICREYGSLMQATYNETISAIAACPACDADVDQHCIGQYGRRHRGSLHSGRRSAAEAWRKANRDEWIMLRDSIFLSLVREKLAERQIAGRAAELILRQADSNFDIRRAL